MLTFTAMDPKSLTGRGRVLLILLLLGAGAGSWALFFYIPLEPFFKIGFGVIGVIFPLMAAATFYQDFLCVITIDLRGIVYKSPLREYRINWNEAAEVGGVMIGRGCTERFELQGERPAAHLASSYIFVTRKPDPPLSWGMSVGPDLIFFKYRDEALARIRLYRPE